MRRSDARLDEVSWSEMGWHQRLGDSRRAALAWYRRQHDGRGSGDHRESEPRNTRRMKTPKGDTARVGRCKLFDWPVDLAPDPFDSRANTELRGGT
jgi:hypothetical protein